MFTRTSVTKMKNHGSFIFFPMINAETQDLSIRILAAVLVKSKRN